MQALLTASEVGAYLNLPESEVRRLTWGGELRSCLPFRFGDLRFKPEDVDDYVNRTARSAA